VIPTDPAFKRIEAERFVGDIHFSARKSLMTDDASHIDEVTVNTVPCPHDALCPKSGFDRGNTAAPGETYRRTIPVTSM
jgi:hypothetical protein